MVSIEDTLDYIIDGFADVFKRRFADDLVVGFAEALNDSERAKRIELEIMEGARKLILAIPRSEVSLFSEMDLRIEQYELDKAAGKPPGLPFGYPTIDGLTGGLRRHELATVCGFTSIGKSTLLRSFSFNFWLEGYTPLYISLEMEAGVILRIFDSMRAGIDHQKMKQLQLSDEEMERWRSHLDEVKARECDIPVLDPSERITPDYVSAEMIRYQPDVCVLDYVQLMNSTSMPRGAQPWQKIADNPGSKERLSCTQYSDRHGRPDKPGRRQGWC